EHGDGGRRFLPQGAEFQVSRAQLEELDRFVTHTLRQTAGQMAAGNIAADPFWRDEEHNACRWCDYRAACHFEPECGDSVRYRRKLDGKEFWSWLSQQEGGEEDGH
ncbi:MAG TPA: PD-(D/E)XK nuclease family protein, partial [Candidatus Enterenecus stercoripullorum]|nr:PD-(D/E)XK nuclease family protein [Candidatus Enterenecus stercoripullorum]